MLKVEEQVDLDTELRSLRNNGMRRRRPERREILPDPVFNDLIVTKFFLPFRTSWFIVGISSPV